MRKFGEIGRVKSDKIEYVIFSHRYDYGQIEIPWFDIRISNKSAKRLNIPQYNLIGNTFNLSTMRNIKKVIQTYLSEVRPQYLAISAHEQDFERRISLYTKRLESMGYFIKEIYYLTYYFELKTF